MRRIKETMERLAMPRVHLTDIVARSAKSASGRQVTFWDTALPCFGLRVGGQVKAWTVMLGEERRRVTIGRYPAMTLQDARAEARRLILSAAVVRRDDISIVTVSVAVEKFVDVHLSQKKASTAKEAERVLRKHFIPAWKGLLMTEINRRHVTRVVDALMERPASANNAFTIVRVFLRWSVRRGYLAHNPMEPLTLPAARIARDRVLDRKELKALLSVVDAQWDFGIIVLLLLLTGQRRGEIGSLRSEWIDRENMTLTLPKHITKNKQEHLLPLTPLALGLLPKREGLLFPARGNPDEPFSGWSKSMNALRRSCKVRDFRLHDLRRTAATLMASKGVAPHVIERVLNHITGSTAMSMTPLGRIYNRYRYHDEMRSALLLLESEVLALLTEIRGSVPLLDAGSEPGKDFTLDPSDAARSEQDTFGEAACLLEAVDVGRGIEN